MENVVWENEVRKYGIYVGNELVKEKVGKITVDDILEIKAKMGLQTIVVLDKETNRALTKDDFPKEGDVVILPVYKAGAF